MARLAAKNFRKRENERTERENGIKETKFSARRCFRSKIGEREKSGAKSRDRTGREGKSKGRTPGHTHHGMGTDTGKHPDNLHTLK